VVLIGAFENLGSVFGDRRRRIPHGHQLGS
jgi:hypothetical protein